MKLVCHSSHCCSMSKTVKCQRNWKRGRGGSTMSGQFPGSQGRAVRTAPGGSTQEIGCPLLKESLEFCLSTWLCGCVGTNQPRNRSSSLTSRALLKMDKTGVLTRNQQLQQCGTDLLSLLSLSTADLIQKRVDLDLDAPQSVDLTNVIWHRFPRSRLKAQNLLWTSRDAPGDLI